MSHPDFRRFCSSFFARLCRGYALALDDTLIRGWLAGHKNPKDHGGAFDLCTRMFPALCAWLAQPARPRQLTVRGLRIDLEELVRAVLERAFDPQEPGHWGLGGAVDWNPRVVEGSCVAYGAWLLRDTVLPTLPPGKLQQLQDWLTHFAGGQLPASNWNLFWVVNQSACKALGWRYAQQRIDQAWENLNRLERPDGWMSDAGLRNFDDYNWWVFGLQELWWCQMDWASNEALQQRVHQRVRRRLEDFPYLFGADGAYTEYGRSLSYKFARLACPVLAYQMGLWPYSAGMLKRLVRLHLSHYDNVGAIDRHTDTIRQELSEFGNPAARDSYISTGHPYWAMHAFASLWQLAEDDPIWTCAEEPLPVEAEDFTRLIAPTGWLLRGCKQSGQVMRYVVGSEHGSGASAAKYAKFVYSSSFPINLGPVEGDFGPDSALCVTDGQAWAHAGAYEAMAATDRYLRGRHKLVLGSWIISCQSILVPLEAEGCLRIHRIVLPRGIGAVSFWEGGSALGYAPGEVPQKEVNPGRCWSMVRLGGLVSTIRGIVGYTQAHLPCAFRGREDLGARHARTLTPLLEAQVPVGFGRPLLLVCRTLASAAGAALEDQLLDVVWNDDDCVSVTVPGQQLLIPPLREGH